MIIALCACAKTVERMKCKNAAENYKKRSRIFWLDQKIKNDVNSQEMLCNKVSENPRNFFFIIFNGIPWKTKFGFGF